MAASARAPVHIAGCLCCLLAPCSPACAVLSSTLLVFVRRLSRRVCNRCTALKRWCRRAGFFSQFGRVSKVRVSRNKKTGAAKHYAFLEFASPEVAAIAAEAMDGYMLFTQARDTVKGCPVAQPSCSPCTSRVCSPA